MNDFLFKIVAHLIWLLLFAGQSFAIYFLVFRFFLTLFHQEFELKIVPFDWLVICVLVEEI